MKILNHTKTKPKRVSAILGFFDGVHLGHREVIKSAVDFARRNNEKSLLITFKKSPAEFFTGKSEYIYPREYSYSLIEELGVDYLVEYDFEKIAHLSAEEYLVENLIKQFEPISISTGFNHTFGANKGGDRYFLENKQSEQGYKYFCVPPYVLDGEIVSSTLIKNEIRSGHLEKAQKMLGRPFFISSKVIRGQNLGAKLGFPTANLEYPDRIIKLPFGVYQARIMDKQAVLNWGKKPTVGDFKEILEAHILNFEADLYGKVLEIEILKKIRDEKKFANVDELKEQIKEDIKVCTGL